MPLFHANMRHNKINPEEYFKSPISGYFIAPGYLAYVKPVQLCLRDSLRNPQFDLNQNT